MRARTYLPASVAAILLIASVVAYYSTRDAPAPGAKAAPRVSPEQPVDTSLLENAIGLATLAATPEEQAQAHEAWRLADHELDLHYAAAMIDAQQEASRRLPPALQDLSRQVTQLQSQVDADKKRVDGLAKDTTGELERAQAQLELEQDQLDAKTEELARKGGDRRARLQRVIQQHEASDKIADQGLKFGTLPPAGTMNEQFRAWLSLAGYMGRLHDAWEQARARNSGLKTESAQLRQQVSGRSEASASAAGLHQMADQQKKLAGFDQRIEDTKELSDAYQAWDAIVANRRLAVLHLLQGSLAQIMAILLAAALLSLAIRSIYSHTDHRRIHQLRVISRIAVQVAAVLLILLIIFGPPRQVSTMIGLITAGITVVMKDFIVAFFGWFTLMGNNGLSVGDWVEIEGVSGEVIEIGLLKTVLLEMGNWTETGHPTGRRVAFPNSFAIEGHFFNFSTSGQWLWDELRLTLPAAGDPYATAEQIREIVEQQTQADAAAAAKDWERVTQHYRARAFSAAPTVNLRPGTSGLELVVRYITRAPQRNAVKSKLFQAIVDLLRKPSMA